MSALCQDPRRTNTQYRWIDPQNKSKGCVCKESNCLRAQEMKRPKQTPGRKKAREDDDEQLHEPAIATGVLAGNALRKVPPIITELKQIKAVRCVAAFSPSLVITYPLPLLFQA